MCLFVKKVFSISNNSVCSQSHFIRLLLLFHCIIEHVFSSPGRSFCHSNVLVIIVYALEDCLNFDVQYSFAIKTKGLISLCVMSFQMLIEIKDLVFHIMITH